MSEKLSALIAVLTGDLSSVEPSVVPRRADCWSVSILKRKVRLFLTLLALFLRLGVETTFKSPLSRLLLRTLDKFPTEAELWERGE